MDSEKRQLLALIKKLSYEKRDVTLSSGKKSNYYIDGKQTTLDGQGAYLVGKLFLDIIKKEFKDIKAVGGLTLGADPITSAIIVVGYSQGMNMKGFIVRKEAKSHGTGVWIEGMKGFAPGDKVAVVEDVVTTGESAIKAVERVQEAGLRVTGIIAMLDRLEGGREYIESKGCRLYSIFTRADLNE